MKTDAQLQKDVIDELKWQPRTHDLEIGVAARDGVVTLSGAVTNYVQKFEAARIAERVTGVKSVADDMTVRLPSSAVRSDPDIAHNIVSAFRWNIEVPDTRITSRVDDGWVTLHGDVDWQYQKATAETVVRFLTGVKGVTNMITVKQPVVAADLVKAQITGALKRSALVDSSRINVESGKDGLVTLRGTVRSWAERNDVARAAWATPGVAKVEDELLVGV